MPGSIKFNRVTGKTCVAPSCFASEKQRMMYELTSKDSKRPTLECRWGLRTHGVALVALFAEGVDNDPCTWGGTQ